MRVNLLKYGLTLGLLSGMTFTMSSQTPNRRSVPRELPSVVQTALSQSKVDSLRTAAERASVNEGQTEAPRLPRTDKKSLDGHINRTDSPETRIYFTITDANLHEPGAYWIDVNDPTFTYHRIGTGAPNASKGGVAVDDIYYATQTYNIPMIDWTVLWNLADSLSFTGTVYDGLYNLFANDATYDPWTDRIIASVINNYGKSTYGMAVLDYERHTKDFFGREYQYGERIQSVAAGPDCYYGIDYNNNFYTIDKFTGETTLIGSTGIEVNAIDGGHMVYEPKTKKLYYSATDNKRNYLSTMYVLDPATGKVEKTLWEDEVKERRYGLWVDEPTTSGCPALVENLALDFELGSVTGKVNFTAPSKSFGGDAITGALTYTVLANGKVVATGSTSCGAAVAADVTLPGAGSYKFSVKTENAVGPSRYARVEQALGFEIPAAPKPVLAVDDNNFSVFWAGVNVSASGSPLDTAAIRYKVTRYPGEVVVAENLDTTSFSETVTLPEEFGLYYYGVQAVYGGVAESAKGLSNSVRSGHIIPAWTQDFDNKKMLEAFTLIDANNDGKVWGFDTLYGREGLLMTGTYGSALNDWIVTPPVKMEPGYFYSIDYALTNKLQSYNKPENVRLFWGNAPTVEGMTEMIKDTVNISSPDWVKVGDYVTPATAGDYYFGLQACTPEHNYALYLRDVTIGEPVLFKAPGVVTDATFLSGYDDPQNVDITFVTPTVCADGTPLSSLTRLEVLRGDTLVVTYNNPRPGTQIHCTDMVSERGRNYIYTIVAYNENGRGKELRIEDFVGIRKPSNPTNVNGWEENGTITLTWDAPAVDEKGNRLNPEMVTYNISYKEDEYNLTSVATGHRGTSITFPYDPSADKKLNFLIVSVTPVTEGGEGPLAASMPIAIGDAATVPFVESFANAMTKHPVGVVRLSGDASWSIYSDANFSDLNSSDNDNGFIGMQAQQQTATGVMSFGKIDMTKMNKPVLSFFVYNITGANPDDNEYEVLINDGKGFASVYKAKVSESGPGGWNKVSVPLNDYKGKVIQLAVSAVTRTYVFSLFDNFRLVEQLSDNLAIGDFGAPSAVAANSATAFTVKVENNGENEARGYTLNLYRDYKPYMSVDVKEPLAAFASVMHTIPVTFTPVDPDEATFMVEVSYDADKDPDDNMSEDKTVKVLKSDLPCPTGFGALANAADTGVDLVWTEPDYRNAVLDAVCESFETATPWNASQAGDWTLVNLNPTAIGGANGITLPGGIEGSTAGFFTFRYGDDSQFNQTWEPHSGNQMLVSLFARNQSKSDHWAISPQLSGDKQTVSLYARSYDATYLESFRIMYSTTDNQPSSFVEAKAFNNIPNTWALYSADLPAGAKYMAINGVSQDKFMLFIDDVTYIPGGDLNLEGYHVYRDGARVTESPVSQTSYSDLPGKGGKYSYQVTACYDRGESRPTDLKTVEISAVGEIPSGVSVSQRNGAIIVEGAEGMNVRIVNAAGIILYAGTPADTLSVNVVPGIYLISVESGMYKMIVK